jgi:glycosyltransferase involved in cell wall biosynthesis
MPAQNKQYPLISLITPSFNQAEFLEACIDSILSQNYPNLEYIILDGGSTDNSLEIIKRHEKHLTFWRSFPDEGHYPAVNEGLNMAKGDVLGWLNSDDMFHPKGLFNLGEIFSALPEVEFLTGKRVGFDKNGSRRDFDLGFAQRWWRERLLDRENLNDPPLFIMQEATYFRRTLWERAGATLDLRYKYAADSELFARLSRFARLYTVDDTIAGFRDYGETQRSKANCEQYKLEALKIIAEEKSNISFNPEWDHEPPPLIRLPLETSRSLAKKIQISRQYTYPIPKQDKFPRISIITPSYNQGQYLEECIDSVLSQNYPNLEYIIMDGGSTDDSVATIKKYEKYLTYWQTGKDAGQYEAINQGFSRSTGAIMAWLNSDDKYYPKAFEGAVAAFQTDPHVSWITGVPTAWSESGDPLWIFRRLPLYSRESVMFTNFADPFIQQESVFWTRPLWEIAGGCLDVRWKYAADLDLWRRFFRYARLYSFNLLVGGCRIHSERRSGLHLNKYFHECSQICTEELSLYKSGQYQAIVPAPEPIMLSI